jgi:hypothetical protein
MLYKEFDESKGDNKKPKGKPYFLFEEGVSQEKISGRVSRIHKIVTTHYKYRHIHELYSQPRINPLALSMYNKISNFMFGDGSAPISDGLAKFIIKGRNGTIWTRARKYFLFKEVDGMCTTCQRPGNLKHFINCCTNKLTSFTYRHDNVGRVIAQAINSYNLQNIVKTENGMMVSWNQELKLQIKIKSVEKNIDIMPVPEDEQGKRRPDIWFCRMEEKKDKDGETIEKSLVCNLVKVTIPWSEVKEFQHIDNTTYKKENITDDSFW